MTNIIKKKIGIRRFHALIYSFLPSKWTIVLAITLVILQAGLSLIIPFLTMGFIDDMNQSGLNLQTIIIMASILIGQLIMSSFALYTMNYIGQKTVLYLREQTWDKILHLPISFFDQNHSGNLMSRMTNDTLILKDFITEQLIPFLSGVISIFGSIILLLIIDWKMTVLMMIIIPLVMMIMVPLGKSMYKISSSLQDETASFQGELGRVLSDIRLVKSSLAENQEKETGLRGMQQLFRYGMKESKILAIVQPLSMSLILIVLVTVFGYGSLRVATGTLSAGAMVAIIFYLFQISVPISQLTTFFTQFQKALGASERIDDIHSTKSEINSLEPIHIKEKENTLAFHGVSFGYLEEKNILNSVNFKANIGQMTAIVGPSGAGKTTLFSLLERFYTPNKGMITYKGRSIHTIPLVEWRSKLAYVSQEAPIMSGTIHSNLTYGLEKYSEERIIEAVTNANLKDFIESLPNNYNTAVGERGIKLSGGQRQRLAIARAMIRDPEILILDEATAHLDSTSESLVQEALERLMKKRTTLVIAHRLSTVKDADQLIIIENGTVTGAGIHNKLLDNHPLYRELNKQQLSTSTFPIH
ncbi:ABC transporter ATP-binding protein [Bacillus sp. A301a_S52]|jgi:ATP-binding cassette subfamily B protein AbcA/BmrA|nr:ABC transporter ATP-binding protein [Bacillus sp. A301a_S52]